MAVVSSRHLILLFLAIVSADFGLADRHRRQVADGSDRNNQPRSPQGQAAGAQSRGFYNSPAFKPPSLSGEKPVGWFDTKYPNWLSNQDSQSDPNGKAEGKNGAPSSLQAGGVQPRTGDAGAVLMEKVAQQYTSKGKKSFNFGPMGNQGSMCTNYDNYNGFVFGKFPCPLPLGAGMNQQDRFCCGPVNSQYCCDAQEFNYNRRPGFSGQHYSRHGGQYTPSSNRAVAIIVPIVGILVVAGALAIVFFYYQKVRKEQTKGSKPSGPARSAESYSAVPQDPPPIPQRAASNSNLQA